MLPHCPLVGPSVPLHPGAHFAFAPLSNHSAWICNTQRTNVNWPYACYCSSGQDCVLILVLCINMNIVYKYLFSFGSNTPSTAQGEEARWSRFIAPLQDLAVLSVTFLVCLYFVFSKCCKHLKLEIVHFCTIQMVKMTFFHCR